MTISKSLPFLLIAVLPLGALAPACSSNGLSTKGQLITCNTDPGTGVILHCEPGHDDGDGTCQDVDEDGDGEPGDGESISRHDHGDSMDDDDGDGVPDSEDCDEHPGEDDCDDGSGVDLPYDIKLGLGDTSRPILDAFAEKGAAPAAIVSVTLDGGAWRLAELQAGMPFTVTATDCSHAGNRDTGRDRVIVTWRNADQSTHSDHLDLRYCDR